MCYPFDAQPPEAAGASGAVTARDLVLTSTDGTKFAAFAATAASPSGAGIVVLPDVRGLFAFYEEFARGFAAQSINAVAIDYFGRTAGVSKRDAEFSFMDHVRQTQAATVAADVGAAVAYLRSPEGGACSSVFTVGFCFGGGTTWNLVNAGAPLAAAVPFYGPLPSNAAGLATTKTAVLAIYAEQDTRITASWPDAQAQLKKSGSPYAQKVEPGVGHAFHNDTNGPSRYGPAQAQEAWVATIEWFRKYLA